MKKVSLLTLFILFVSANANAESIIDCEQNKNDELMCLACNLYHEARGESETDQMMVGHTTYNRVKNKHYPNDVCSVVWQKTLKTWTEELSNGDVIQHQRWIPQFSWTLDGLSDRVHEGESWRTALAIAKLVKLHHEDEYFMFLPDGVDDIDNVMWFYNPDKVNPFWAEEKVEVVRTSGHRFMSMPE